MTSFGKKDLSVRYPITDRYAQQMRRRYLPVHPTPPHPDTKKKIRILYTRDREKWTAPSYVNVSIQYRVPRCLFRECVRPNDTSSGMHVLDEDSYGKLTEITGFSAFPRGPQEPAAGLDQLEQDTEGLEAPKPGADAEREEVPMEDDAAQEQDGDGHETPYGSDDDAGDSDDSDDSDSSDSWDYQNFERELTDIRTKVTQLEGERSRFDQELTRLEKNFRDFKYDDSRRDTKAANRAQRWAEKKKRDYCVAILFCVNVAAYSVGLFLLVRTLDNRGLEWHLGPSQHPQTVECGSTGKDPWNTWIISTIDSTQI